MQYTPGPWKVSDKYPNPFTRNLQRQIIPNHSGDSLQIATVQAARSNLDIEFEANAKLIAAAPDLLNAVRECLKALESYAAKDEKAMNIARAAITKATQQPG